MYHQPVFRKSSGFYEESDRKNTYGNGADPFAKDTGRSFKGANLQEIFLNNCRKNENIVNIELIQGQRHTGKIIGFDSQSVILAASETQFLIYKSAISSVIPEKPVQYIFNELHRHDYCDIAEYDYLHAAAEEACNNT